MKDSFIFYLKQFENIKDFDDEQLGRLFRKIFIKLSGNDVEIDKDIKIAFNFIWSQIEMDSQKWKEEKEKRSEAGKKGMELRWKNDNNVITDDNKNNSVKSVITDDNKNNSVITDDNKNNSVKSVITRHNKNN